MASFRETGKQRTKSPETHFGKLSGVGFILMKSVKPIFIRVYMIVGAFN